MTTEPGIAPRATSRGSRSRRAGLMNLLTFGAVIAFVIAITAAIWFAISPMFDRIISTGGSHYTQWDLLTADAKATLREIYAGMTGQSLQTDLFP